MEQHLALWNTPVKCKSKEYLLWNAAVAEPASILKSKLSVVLRMPDQAAAFGTQFF